MWKTTIVHKYAEQFEKHTPKIFDVTYIKSSLHSMAHARASIVSAHIVCMPKFNWYTPNLVNWINLLKTDFTLILFRILIFHSHLKVCNKKKYSPTLINVKRIEIQEIQNGNNGLC